MAFIPTPNTARTNMVFTTSGVEWSIQLHFRYLGGGAIDLTSLTDLNNNIAASAIALLMPNLATTATLSRIISTDVSTQNGVQHTLLVGQAGGAIGDPMPLNVAFVVKHLTLNTGRSFRGRSYLAAFTEAQVNSNQLIVTIADDFVDFFTNMRSSALLDDWQFVVVSFVANGVPRLNGLATEVVQTTYTDLRVDTRRKRLP